MDEDICNVKNSQENSIFLELLGQYVYVFGVVCFAYCQTAL